MSDKNIDDREDGFNDSLLNKEVEIIEQVRLLGFEKANYDNKQQDIDNDSLPDKTKNAINVSQRKNDEKRHSNDSSSISDVSRNPSDSEIEATSKSATVVDVSYISYMILVL